MDQAVMEVNQLKSKIEQQQEQKLTRRQQLGIDPIPGPEQQMIPEGAKDILDPSAHTMLGQAQYGLPSGLTPGEYAAMPPEH